MTDVCPVCGASGTQPCSTKAGRDHRARWATPTRVYGWTGSRTIEVDGKPAHIQTREIMCADSIAEVLRTAGITRATWNWSGSETGNSDEITNATRFPRTVLWVPLNDSHRPNPAWRSET